MSNIPRVTFDGIPAKSVSVSQDGVIYAEAPLPPDPIPLRVVDAYLVGTKPLRKCDRRNHGWRKGRHWIKGAWFCIKCGTQDVWQISDAGNDYYVGYSATCHSCEHVMQCLDHVAEPI